MEPARATRRDAPNDEVGGCEAAEGGSAAGMAAAGEAAADEAVMGGAAVGVAVAEPEPEPEVPKAAPKACPTAVAPKAALGAPAPKQAAGPADPTAKRARAIQHRRSAGSDGVARLDVAVEIEPHLSKVQATHRKRFWPIVGATLAAALATVIVLLVLDVLNAHPRIALTRVATHLNDELPDSVRAAQRHAHERNPGAHR